MRKTLVFSLIYQNFSYRTLRQNNQQFQEDCRNGEWTSSNHWNYSGTEKLILVLYIFLSLPYIKERFFEKHGLLLTSESEVQMLGNGR